MLSQTMQSKNEMKNNVVDIQLIQFRSLNSMKKLSRSKKKQQHKIVKYQSQFKDISLPPINEYLQHIDENMLDRKKKQRSQNISFVYDDHDKPFKRQAKLYSKRPLKQNKIIDNQSYLRIQKNYSKLKLDKGRYEIEKIGGKGKIKNKKINARVSVHVNSIEKCQQREQSQKACDQVKILFNQIKDKLQLSPKRLNQTQPIAPYYRSQSFTNIIRKEELNVYSATNSIMQSPRAILQEKARANRDVNTMVQTLSMQIGRLQKCHRKSQQTIKSYINEKIRCMGAQNSIKRYRKQGNAKS